MKKFILLPLLTCLLIQVGFAQTECPENISVAPNGSTLTLIYANNPGNGFSSALELEVTSGGNIFIFLGGILSPQPFPVTLDGMTNWYVVYSFSPVITESGSYRVTFSNGLTCDYGADFALPVEFMSFEGRVDQEDVVLEWSTAWEYNNAGFEVQRSFDGRTFNTIDAVQGVGTTDLEQHYSYVDQQISSYARSSTIYYRLKQIDFEGLSDYSDIIAIQLPKVEVKAVDFISLEGLHRPDGDITLTYSIPRDQKVQTLVTNLMGEVFFQESREASQGVNTARFKLPSYGSTQMYIVSIRTRDGQFNQKFMQVDM